MIPIQLNTACCVLLMPHPPHTFQVLVNTAMVYQVICGGQANTIMGVKP